MSIRGRRSWLPAAAEKNVFGGEKFEEFNGISFRIFEGVLDRFDVKTRPEFHHETRDESCRDHLQGKFTEDSANLPRK